MIRRVPPQMRNKKDFFSFHFYLNIVLEVLATVIRQERYLNWKGKSKIIITDDMIFYIENPNESTKKLSELCKIIARLQDTRKYI